MRKTAVFPGRYIQAEGALETLDQEIARLGESAFIIAGGTARRDLIPAYKGKWDLKFTLGAFGGECCQAEVDRLSLAAKDAEVVVGMGGGKVLDTAKAVAHALKLPMVMVPTIASTDAPCSAVSVLYTPTGEFDSYLFLPKNPDLVLVDTAVIAKAPVRFLVAGMGDALSTWFEGDACRRAYASNQCGGLGTLAGYALARLCYDTILEHGVAAKVSCEAGVVTPALEHVVEANTLHSGLGFECAGLASAHSIHNGLTVLEPTHHYYHGEKVAIGVLAGLFLGDRPSGLVNQVFAFCEAVGLPTTLADIGLEDVGDEDLMKVAERACQEGETIHHEPGPVSPAAVVAALRTADAIGRSRKPVRGQVPAPA